MRDRKLTPIRITITGDPPQYEAYSPCAPHVVARADEEHDAVNGLMADLRARTDRYVGQDRAVPWIVDGWGVAANDEIEIGVTGLWPAAIDEVHASKEHNNGTD